MNTQSMIVFSHLRWEFVKQRPQHIIERMSSKYSVLFVEEPIGKAADGKLSAHEIQVSKNITVIQPRLDSIETQGYSSIVAQYMNKLHFRMPLLWFYSASFVPLLEHVPHSTVVYDCMDELAAFLGAPPSLIQQEEQLLRQADVVFTGGHSLYMSKKNKHSNVYSFPSSVEKKHFQQAFTDTTHVPLDLQQIPKPVAGFYGVLDERLDLSLISHIAKKNPDISFVFIGPMVKINPEAFPKAKNIYRLGPRSYNDLPGYLKGFDITFMPFARNDATRFISPTKTLEFMSVLKPIISTRIHDVEHDFRKEVDIADTKQDFVAYLQFYKKEPMIHKMHRKFLQKTTIMNHSWDKTVEEMLQIIENTQNKQYVSSQEVEEDTDLSIQGVSYI